MYVKWKPPAQTNIMLNTDCAIHASSMDHFGLGGVFRNNTGEWLLGFRGSCNTVDVLEGEIYKLILGLQCILRELDNPQLHHIYRQQNRLADAIASLPATTFITTLFWESPESLSDILRADKNKDLAVRRVKSSYVHPSVYYISACAVVAGPQQLL
ncbi:hypothetical protein P3L10_006487 [Capsicum annuum]